MGMRYHVADPNSYLVITGAGIDGVQIKKKAWLWPMQKVTKISITPFDFSMSLQAMTVEKLKFSLPAVFTIGPLDSVEAMTKYAVLLTGESDGTPIPASSNRTVGTGRNHVQEIVKGIIEGETRSIVSTMTMEELFKERQIFKKKVIDSVQSELDQFGLCIYNANVKELQDTPGSEYFAFLSRKAHEGALNQAKVDVAEARMRGEVGEAEKQGKAKQEVAKIHAATAVLETERKGEKASADAKLTNKEIQIEKELTLERISAKRAAETRDAQLQKDLEVKRAEMELERLRATTVTQARIARESAEQKAQADLYTSNKKADGVKYQQAADAEATFIKQQKEIDATALRITRESEAHYIQQKADADGAAYRRTCEAEATLLARRKEAEATFLARKAEADGLAELARAYGQLAGVLGGPQGLLQYLMLRDGVFVKMADANARAISGLQPRISVWSNGQDGDTAAPIRDIYKNLAPMIQTVQEQTGILPPTWLAQVPGQVDEEALLAKKKLMVNGVHG